MSTEFDFSDSVVLVTGVGGALGSATAGAVLDAGATVCGPDLVGPADDFLLETPERVDLYREAGRVPRGLTPRQFTTRASHPNPEPRTRRRTRLPRVSPRAGHSPRLRPPGQVRRLSPLCHPTRRRALSAG